MKCRYIIIVFRYNNFFRTSFKSCFLFLLWLGKMWCWINHNLGFSYTFISLVSLIYLSFRFFSLLWYNHKLTHGGNFDQPIISRAYSDLNCVCDIGGIWLIQFNRLIGNDFMCSTQSYTLSAIGFGLEIVVLTNRPCIRPVVLCAHDVSQTIGNLCYLYINCPIDNET